MAPSDEVSKKLDDIERRVEAIHTAIVGDLQGKTGLVRRLDDLEGRVSRLEALTTWGRTLASGAVAALVSAWAIWWGGPHAK
jgi:tetrahydromethanopterin S-methyltransferase subunit G